MTGFRNMLIGVFGATLLLVTIMPVASVAQICKPSVSGKDKITKVQVDEWSQILYQTGILAQVTVETAEVDVFGSVSKNGDANAISVILKKSETKKARAELESPYRAEKGNEFIFGFKQGGEPLRFTADEVTNETAADLWGHLNTRAVLTAHLNNEGLRALRESMAGKTIDTVRVSLANNLVIQKSVKDKNGMQFVAAIGCFLAVADKGPASSPDELASVSGKYIRKGKSSDYMDLKPDATFLLRQNGKDYSGNYGIQGNTITFAGPKIPPSIGRFSRDTILDPTGDVWERQTESQQVGGTQVRADPVKLIPPQPSETVAATPKPLEPVQAVQSAPSTAGSSRTSIMTNDDIIQMVTAGLSDQVISTSIRQASKKDFDLTAQGLIALKKARVSDALILVMQDGGAAK